MRSTPSDREPRRWRVLLGAVLIATTAVSAGFAEGAAVAATPAACTDFVAVAAGVHHNLAIGRGGVVYAWGRNDNGELGDGTTTARAFAVPVRRAGGAPLDGVVAVAAGQYHSMALDSFGGIWSWGSNGYGQLGDLTLVGRTTPGRVLRADGLPLDRVTAIGAGDLHSLAVSDGTLHAWGWNTYEQSAPTWNGFTPTVVRDASGLPVVGVMQLDGGGLHSLAVQAGGRVLAWGHNGYGPLQPGSGATRQTPEPVEMTPGVPLVGAATASGGMRHSLAIGAGGSVLAWGDNSSGSLGDGTTTSSPSARLVSGPGGGVLAGATAVSAGAHSLALGPGGTVLAWGQNTSGNLGDGTTVDRPVPALVNDPDGRPFAGVTAVSAGRGHSIVLAADGRAFAWGQNGAGELGDGTLTDRLRPVLVRCSAAPAIDAIPHVAVDAPSGYASDACGDAGTLGTWTPTGTLTTVRLGFASPAPNTTYICVRADGAPVHVGGRLAITGAAVGGPQAPVVDDDADACSRTGGNLAPGPHPVFDAAVGDPADPTTYVPVHLDTFSDGRATWLCVTVGSVSKRVRVAVSGSVAAPAVTFTPDVAGPHAPTPPTLPAKPSGACAAAASATRFLDAFADDNRVAVYGHAPSSTSYRLCVRADGPLEVGGALLVESDAGSVPQVTTSTTDVTACAVQVARVGDPASVEVRRSAATALPASVCVITGDTVLRVTVAPAGGDDPVRVSWTPDPGTPGLP